MKTPEAHYCSSGGATSASKTMRRIGFRIRRRGPLDVELRKLKADLADGWAYFWRKRETAARFAIRERRMAHLEHALP